MFKDKRVFCLTCYFVSLWGHSLTVQSNWKVQEYQIFLFFIFSFHNPWPWMPPVLGESDLLYASQPDLLKHVTHTQLVHTSTNVLVKKTQIEFEGYGHICLDCGSD